MKNEHILVVEDDKHILELISYNLRKEGYRVTCVSSGEKALLKIGSDMPDLILLDLMLPGLDGNSICRQIRGESNIENIPIIMVTAKGEDEDIIKGLEEGADDYIIKPFSIQVLLARVKTVLKRKTPQEKKKVKLNTPLKIHDFLIDKDRHKVSINDIQLDLTFTEFRILYYLAGHAGRVFTRNQIVEAVRGSDYAVTDRSVDVIIFGLRKKLGEYGEYVETVRGIGYRFRE